MKLCLKGKLSNFKDTYAAFQLIYSLPVSPSIALHPEGYVGTKKLFFSLDIYALQCHLHPIKKRYIIYIYIVSILSLATKQARTTYICSVAV